ncbi:tetratricopeptide repeat protein [Pedobacter sp. BS3]|uniref:tetratricopeptide repeat protein n=1 Tax=Pedobacter sp. BS3 TaxID=2567937 RepID=UPI0011EF664B|nr:tetratricopeptide repeat protein [Pedobacter sp. BS3]TZF80804.1 tetratricopeptide repeat protein [Pedobacter sp. BS3]
MRHLSLLLLYFLLYLNKGVCTNRSVAETKAGIDTNLIISLNERGYSIRLTNPTQTQKYADSALSLSKKINYKRGIAEAYRVSGIAKYYLNQNDSSIQNFLRSLSLYSELKDKQGEAKVYNNIGNLYRDVDYNKSLEYYHESLKIAENIGEKELVAGLFLNIGIVCQKKKAYLEALQYFKKSHAQFSLLNNNTGIAICYQNISIVYRHLKNFDQSEDFAKKAIAIARQSNLNFIIASTNITLSLVYIAKNELTKAENAIKEGITYAKLIKDEKLYYDLLIGYYTLEQKRGNYKQAFNYLQQVYRRDSLTYKNNISEKISLLQEQYKAREIQRENELTIQKQRTSRVILWSSILIAALLAVVVIMLLNNVKKKQRTNNQLTALNQEILLQKENLDRINHNLEAIISERTNDLKVKNDKLSQYSFHLSHQIRSPIATIKGLMSLEKDNLIDREEFIQQLERCVNDIDNKILHINEMLHNAQSLGFKKSGD